MVGIALHGMNIEHLLSEKVMEVSGAYIVLPPSIPDDQVGEIVRWHQRGCTEPHPAGLEWKHTAHKQATEDAQRFKYKFGESLVPLLLQLVDSSTGDKLDMDYGDRNTWINCRSRFLDVLKTYDDPKATSIALKKPISGYILGGFGMWTSPNEHPFSGDIDELHSIVTRLTPFFSLTAIDIVGKDYLKRIAEEGLRNTIKKLPGYEMKTILDFMSLR